MRVTRIWAKDAIRLHQQKGYLALNASDFEAKAAYVIGFYPHSLQHAGVFCVDKRQAIQARDRINRKLHKCRYTNKL